MMESVSTIRIAILDDDAEFGKVLSSVLEDVAQRRKWEVQIDIYTNTNELDKVPVVYDLLFLDVELEQENGIEWVAKWKKIRKFQEIIVVSSYDQYVFDSFRVRPLAFIRKTYLKEDLKKAVHRFDLERRGEPVRVMILDGQKKLLFNPYEIEYFKANAHYVDVMLHNHEPKMIRNTINTLQQQMEKYGFVRIQVSYLVNMQYITRIDRKYIYLQDGSIKQISSKYKDQLFERLRIYMRTD